MDLRDAKHCFGGLGGFPLKLIYNIVKNQLHYTIP